MKYDICFSKYINERFPDHWEFETIEADSEKDAFKKLCDIHNKNGKHINYVLSCDILK